MDSTERSENGNLIGNVYSDWKRTLFSPFSALMNGDATFFITASKIPEVSNFVNLKQGAFDCKQTQCPYAWWTRLLHSHIDSMSTWYAVIMSTCQETDKHKIKNSFKCLPFLTSLFGRETVVISDAKVTHPWFSAHRLPHFSFVVAWKAHDHLQPLSLATILFQGDLENEIGWTNKQETNVWELFGNFGYELRMSVSYEPRILRSVFFLTWIAGCLFGK